MPSSSLPAGKTPFELFEQEMPNYHQLHVYSCAAYVLDYKAKTHNKLAPRSHIDVLVGYAAKNQWLVWDGKSVKTRQDIVFNKTNLPFYKPDIVETLVEEPITDTDPFDLLTSVRANTQTQQTPDARDIIILLLDNNDDNSDIYRVQPQHTDIDQIRPI